MKIISIGGGPAGLYLGILMKKADPGHEIRVLERNRPDDTFGFGVVFSDATLGHLRDADAPTYDAITRRFSHWDAIDTHYRGQVITSVGHGFSGLSRRALLGILQARALELGVRIDFEHEVENPDPLLDADLVLGADGVNSIVRARYADHFRPTVDNRPNRFVWLGTTRPFDAFTFHFRKNEHGLFRVHAYQYGKPSADRSEPCSTFIVECTEDTWRRAGLDRADEDATVAYCERLFVVELAGHRLIKNRSLWRSFPNIRCARWHYRNLVLMGDAVHTAHFSIGSGTKLAMEDAIALRDALVKYPGHVDEALTAYEVERRPAVESVQRAAQVSLRWFEETERYFERLEPLQFTYSMLTRSLRLDHATLARRDPGLVGRVEQWFAGEAASQSGVEVAREPPPPPMFTPLKLRGLVLPNRVGVSPMCQYSARDGVPDEWHLVHLGSRAVGGAGLVMAEATGVSPEGRITDGCTGMWSDAQEAGFRRVVEFVHGHTAAKIGLQLGHAGRKASTRRPWHSELPDQPLAEGNWPIVAPSAIPCRSYSQTPREMTRADMEAVRDAFAGSAQRAERAGFDLVELHFAHGYLLSTFLSPLTNQRRDEFGGPLVKRMRFPLEVFDAVRAVWPSHKPIAVRLSATDWVEGGFGPADAVEVARALREHGCDIVDVSAGGVVPEQKPEHGRLFQTPFADRIRNEAGIPTMTVGAVSSWADVNAILAAGRADLCLLARGHLYDPYWTRHAAFEQGHELPWPAQYRPVRTYTPRT